MNQPRNNGDFIIDTACLCTELTKEKGSNASGTLVAAMEIYRLIFVCDRLRPNIKGRLTGKGSPGTPRPPTPLPLCHDTNT